MNDKIKELFEDMNQDGMLLSEFKKRLNDIFSVKHPEHKISFIGKLDQVTTEDGGQALISDPFELSAGDNGIFVRVQSWDEEKEHKEFKKFQDKEIRITVETVD
jgi:hypothetical protein